ncbi:MAG: Na-translocating system protein MpsC family protein [Solirubrobacteraceae bacterium]
MATGGQAIKREDQGATLAAVSRRIVGLLKEHYGKGPTKARTYYSGDLVVVLLSGGYTQAERTLIEEGRSRAVMDLRAELQEVMNERFRQVIEEELQREVIAFMSAGHHDPDYNAEVFVLASRETEGSDGSADVATGDELQYGAED